MTRLADKVRVIPLESTRLRRIEQRVLAEAFDTAPGFAAPRWFSRAMPAVGFAAASALGAIALWLVSNPGKPMARYAPSIVPIAQTAPAHVTTGSDATVIELSGARVQVAAHSRLTLSTSAGRGTTVELEAGRVDCEVQPRVGRDPFWVAAGDVNVRVVGTVFAVARDGSAVQVEVTRGKVSVTSPSGERAVAAGESWTEVAGVVALARTDAVVPAPAPADSTGAGETTPRKHTPVASTAEPAADRPKRANTSRSKPKGQRLPRPERGRAPVSSELEAARSIEADDPTGAAEQYRRVAYSKTGPVASYAMYSLAYVQMYRLGDPEAAAETAGVYGRRFPRGREARAALWLRVRALCKSGDAKGCRAAAHSYLDRHPTGRFAADAHRIANQ